MELGALLGRLPEAVRDKYRIIRLGDARKSGAWSPEEEGKLTNLVTTYLAERPAVRVDSSPSPLLTAPVGHCEAVLSPAASTQPR